MEKRLVLEEEGRENTSGIRGIVSKRKREMPACNVKLPVKGEPPGSLQSLSY